MLIILELEKLSLERVNIFLVIQSSRTIAVTCNPECKVGVTWFLCRFLMTWVLTLLGETLFTSCLFQWLLPTLFSCCPTIQLLAFLVKLFLLLTCFERITVFESCLDMYLAAVITLISYFSFSKSWFLNIQIRRNKLIPKISPSWDSMTAWHCISCPGCWHDWWEL